MRSVSLSERAAQDLIDIYLYTLEHHGAVQAEDYTSNLERTLSLLADNPHMGRIDKRQLHCAVRRRTARRAVGEAVLRTRRPNCSGSRRPQPRLAAHRAAFRLRGATAQRTV